MAKRRCKKFGIVKSGPRKGLCRKQPARKTRKAAKKRGRRGNCEKFGVNPRTGKCYKSMPRPRSHFSKAAMARAAKAHEGAYIFGPGATGEDGMMNGMRGIFG